MRNEIQRIKGNAGFQFDEIALDISLESQVKKQYPNYKCWASVK